MRRGGALSALVAVTAAVAAGPAAADETVAEGVVGVGIDGGHLVAWRTPGAVAVFDDRSGARSDVPFTRECDSSFVHDGIAGRFLVSCDDRYVVLDTRDSSFTEIETPAGAAYSRIGRHWLRGTAFANGHQTPAYTNWHTSETRYGGTRLFEPSTPFDLDTPDLARLAPKRRDFVTGQSRALAEVGRSGHRAVELTYRHRSRRIARCSDRCNPRSVKGGLALWSAKLGRVDGYVLRTRRRRSWTIPEASSVQGSTRRRVYYLASHPGDPIVTDLKSFRWHR